MKTEARKINDYLAAKGLPTQTPDVLEDLLSSVTEGTAQQALRVLLTSLRYEAHEKHYGKPPKPWQVEIMARKSEEDAAEADLR